MLLAEIVSLANKKLFIIYQIFEAAKTVPPKGNVFLTNASFRLVETNFLSSRNSIVLFRTLLNIKIRGYSLVPNRRGKGGGVKLQVLGKNPLNFVKFL